MESHLEQRTLNEKEDQIYTYNIKEQRYKDANLILYAKVNT